MGTTTTTSAQCLHAVRIFHPCDSRSAHNRSPGRHTVRQAMTPVVPTIHTSYYDYGSLHVYPMRSKSVGGPIGGQLQHVPLTVDPTVGLTAMLRMRSIHPLLASGHPMSV